MITQLRAFPTRTPRPWTQLQSSGAPDEDQWQILEYATPIPVPVGNVPLTVIEVFEPDAVGSFSIEFLVAGDDAGYPQQTVTLLGEGVTPMPIDSVLVLDRSGSMDESAGERRKIDAMRDAADMYAHLLRRDTGGGSGDTIGLVKYNESSSTYLALRRVDDPATVGSHMHMLETEKLSNAALADSSRLRPDGATGIGGAMNTATGMFAVPAGERRHLTVVFTDGKENRTPRIADVLGPIEDANPDLSTYSVGVGDDVDETNLQAITNAGNGHHQFSSELSGLDVFALEMFYFKIFASAAGLELASDPAAAVPLGAAEPIVVHRARVMSSDRSATFVVLDNPALREFYDLQLISPHGQVMGSGAVAGSSTVHYLQRHTYTICKVLLPDPEVTLDLVGDWKLVLAPRHGDEGAPIVQDVDTPAIAGLSSYAGTRLAPIGFAAAVAVASNYRMEVQVTAPSTTPGSRVVLTARLTDRGWPAGGGKVFVDVTRPDGTAVQTIPLQPAEAGTWMGEFTPTQAPGSYRFLFRARGRNAFGEVVSREASRMVTLTWPTPDTPPWSPSHLGCSLFWMVIVVLAVVLPWLVWLILRFT